MLPDFPKLKSKLRAILNQRMKQTAYGGGIVSRVRRFSVHEGQGFIMQRADRSVGKTEFRERSVEQRLTKDELISLSPKDLIEKVDKMAAEMARQTTKDLFEEMHKVTSETGNVVDGKSRPFSFNLFLEGLRKVDVDFDNLGNLSGMTIVVPPEIGKRIPELLEHWKSDEEYKRRFDEVMAIKREEWRVREGRRKLVN